MNNASVPMATSLTVFSINYTTSFHCKVGHAHKEVASRIGTVTVNGM